MALTIADRVRETTTTTGTGTITLNGAVGNFETFTSNLSDGDTTYYAIVDANNSDFEVGLGTFASSGTTLARTTVIASSNSNSAVNLSSGSKDVFITLPASKMVFQDASGRVGIGTTTPSRKLHVSSSSGTAVKVETSDNDKGLIEFSNNGSSTTSFLGSADNDMQFGTGGSERMRIDSSGNVGIGTTSPATALDVQGNASFNGTVTANAGLKADNITIDGTEIDLSSGDLTIDVAGDIVLDSGGGDIFLHDDGVEFGRFFNSNGNFQIQTTTSDADFNINGNDGGSSFNALTLDMSEAGAATFNSTVTATGFIIGSANINENDLESIDDVTAGTISASKAAVVDTNKDITGFRNITLTGELDAGSLDVSGDADIDGTLEVDAITVNGTALNTVIAGVTVTNATNATLASTVTVTDSTANTNFPVVFHDESNALLDDTGALRYNPSTGELLVPKLTVAGTTTTVDTVTMNAQNAIVFEGATADAHETTLTIVDPTADRTINLPNVSGTIPVLAAVSTTQITSTPEELNILDGVTSTAAELNILDGVTATAAELNILDGATVVVGEINALDLGSTAVGTAIASKAVILDSNKDYTGIRNFTITGEIDAATGDFSGDVDVDGTLEADAITVNGTALNTVIGNEATALAIALG